MSHANGKILFNDGTVMHYEYNGTADVAISCLYDDYGEMIKNWRNQPWNECTCGNAEPVKIFTDYGFGFFWDGTACKKCKAIVDGQAPFDEEDAYISMVHKTPDWAK